MNILYGVAAAVAYAGAAGFIFDCIMHDFNMDHSPIPVGEHRKTKTMRMRYCPVCLGERTIERQCMECAGTGVVERLACWNCTAGTEEVCCPGCQGAGRVEDNRDNDNPPEPPPNEKVRKP